MRFCIAAMLLFTIGCASSKVQTVPIKYAVGVFCPPGDIEQNSRDFVAGMQDQFIVAATLADTGLSKIPTNASPEAKSQFLTKKGYDVGVFIVGEVLETDPPASPLSEVKSTEACRIWLAEVLVLVMNSLPEFPHTKDD